VTVPDFDLQLVREALNFWGDFADHERYAWPEDRKKVDQALAALDRLEARLAELEQDNARRLTQDESRVMNNRLFEMHDCAKVAEARLARLKEALGEISKRQPEDEESPFARHAVMEFTTIACVALAAIEEGAEERE
jgi:hypothetical protein